MVFDIPAFRTIFPEFASPETYPTAMITFYSNQASLMLDQCIWKNMWVNGVSYYTAHQLVLAAQNAKAAQIGGSPGQQSGIANTKTVGSVTAGYDSTVSSEKDAGFWNLTNYGKQFYRLMRIFGTRPVQL